MHSVSTPELKVTVKNIEILKVVAEESNNMLLCILEPQVAANNMKPFECFHRNERDLSAVVRATKRFVLLSVT
jgi:hypothetical protein